MFVSESGAARQGGAPARGKRGGALIAAVPVVMVNSTAFIGQFAWVRQHVPWALPGQVLFAVTLEVVAIYLAWHAHQAQMANDSAGRLKLGSYLFALIIGAMNYSHYALHWHPNALAVGLGLMSTLSPWLWGIHSRRASRDALMAQGLVEPHAVRLGANRWTWHAFRSVQVMWHATWIGESDPKRAIALYEARQAARAQRHAARQPAVVAQIEAAQAVAQPARQRIEPTGAPAVAQLPATAVPAVPPAPAGPLAPTPGTQVNGRTVHAIATLKAKPAVRSHKLDHEVLDRVTLHLAGLSGDALPSERDVAKMLCNEHDHRRQAIKLINARKIQGVPPVVSLVRRQANGHQQMIAVPVGTLPGGTQAHG